MDALTSGYGLIEGPVWDPTRGLLFSDVVNGGVRALAEATVLAGCLVLAAVACILMPFFDTFLTVALVAFLFGLGIGGGAPLSMSLVFSRSPEARSGEAMGMRQTVNKGTEMVVPAAFGAISTTFGMMPLFWMVAALLGVGGWFMQRDAKALPKVDNSGE